MPHPDEGLIHAWLDGELGAAEAARVEALVASDPGWAAAAAEARGLIAASAGIVGALDRVPANVITQIAAPPRRGARQWAWRAAAVLALMAGSAVVLQRGTPVADQVPAPAARKAKPAPTIARADSSKAAVPAAPAERGLASNAPVFDAKGAVSKKELDVLKRSEPVRDKDVASAAGELRAKAAGGTGAANFTSPAPSCFSQREPRDSAARIIRLDAAVLADSIRLEKLTLHGDTLAAVNGRLIAVLVRCPAP